MRLLLISASLFIPVALGLTAVSAVTYIEEQQILRQSANEPQRSLAYHALVRLQQGSTPATVAAGDTVVIEVDPSVWIMVTDAVGRPIAGTGQLHNALPMLPAGIYDVARTDQIDILTWQPEQGVRQAIVALKAPDGFIVSGRSLVWTEWQEDLLTKQAMLGWVGEMIVALLGALVGGYLLSKVKSTP
jgi:hypothetical protein